MNMKRLFLVIATGLTILSLNNMANATDALASFNPTIQKLEISRDGGKTWVTVFDNNTAPVDLVAINGQNVGTFLGSAVVPSGRYNKSRVTVTDTTFSFTVNDDLGHGNGTINITSNNIPAGTFPLTEIDDISISITDGGTVNGVINFDAATSYSGLTYIWNGGAAPNQYTFTGVTFNPKITVAE